MFDVAGGLATGDSCFVLFFFMIPLAIGRSFAVVQNLHEGERFCGGRRVPEPAKDADDA